MAIPPLSTQTNPIQSALAPASNQRRVRYYHAAREFEVALQQDPTTLKFHVKAAWCKDGPCDNKNISATIDAPPTPKKVFEDHFPSK